MMKKLRLFIRTHLPYVTRREYNQDIDDLLTVISALTQSEKQHAQLEMSIMQNMGKLGKGPIQKEDVKKEGKGLNNDPAFN